MLKILLILLSFVVIENSSPSTFVCNKSYAIQEEILRQIDKNRCADITRDDLSRIVDLPLQQKYITSLKRGDFDGLSNLIKIDLSNNQLQSLPKGIFNTPKDLERIILSGNRLKTLPDGIFTTTTDLILVDLANNELRSIPEGTFSFEALIWLERLYLQQNVLILTIKIS